MPATKKALFSRYVELGRVVLISFGPDAGKLATVIDIVDQNRVRSSSAAAGAARERAVGGSRGWRVARCRCAGRRVGVCARLRVCETEGRGALPW